MNTEMYSKYSTLKYTKKKYDNILITIKNCPYKIIGNG